MFDPKEFIKVSQDLCEKGTREAEYRTAISRALYGVFLWLREELESRGEYVKVADPSHKADEHSKVRERLRTGRYAHAKARDRLVALVALYELRYASDYDLEKTLIKNDALQEN